MKNGYFRKNISAMQAYVPGIQPREPGWLKLNTNENPFPPSPEVLRAVADAVNESLRLYPDPSATEFCNAAAKVCKVKPEMILPGNGSDEILSIIARSFLGENDVALMLNPTYSLFETLVQVQGSKLIVQKLNSDFNLPEELFQRKAQCAFIANPNPQAGTLFSISDMERLSKSIGGILVIDEAYVDFATRNCLSLIEKYENVIVTRSLSKSYSLAGIRAGYAVANESLVSGMKKVKDSYNLDRLTIVAASVALRDAKYFKKNVKEVIKQRKFLSESLTELGFEVMTSQANFILAKPPAGISARTLYKELLARQVLVRFFDKDDLREYVRISVGSLEQNNDLLKAIKLAFIRFNIDYPETSFGVVKF